MGVIVALLIGIVIDVLIGALVGWLAGKFMKSQGSFMRNAIMGILGSVVAGLLLPDWLGIIGSIIGACLVIWVYEKFIRK
ncbi:MAG: GlsB/YeaQ/YmgE family stress response membrane protein [Lachnospiraceae bacterium]|nr:GlsB/YeaQ/YmgE family stress response membrane protein [Lachnospiraceae bacterium]